MPPGFRYAPELIGRNLDVQGYIASIPDIREDSVRFEFEITKQAVSKHIQVLEQAQLVTRTRDAQRRPVHLNSARLEALTAWIDRYRLVREEQFRRLDAVLDTRAADRGQHTQD